jgi:hypothetical protein
MSDLSMALANAAGRLRPHAIVLRGGCIRRLGRGDTGVAKAGMALTPLPESLLDGSVAQQVLLSGMFLPSVQAGRVSSRSLACDSPPFCVGGLPLDWVQHIVQRLAPAGVAGFVLADGLMSSNCSGEGEMLSHREAECCPWETSSLPTGRPVEQQCAAGVT